MAETYTILICDDDPDIVAALDIYLRAEGYRTLLAKNGSEALQLAEKNDVHLLLLDVMMPGLDGIAATLRLRETHNFPIILLTAKSEDSDKVLGLTVGADDYVTKPFNPMELMARVKSQLRRYTRLGAIAERPERLVIGLLLIFSFSRIELDDAAKAVTVDGEPVSLTPIEYNILKLLMEHPGRVYSSRQIYEAAWSGPAYGAENTVPVHIRHLRAKRSRSTRPTRAT